MLHTHANLLCESRYTQTNLSCGSRYTRKSWLWVMLHYWFRIAKNKNTKLGSHCCEVSGNNRDIISVEGWNKFLNRQNQTKRSSKQLSEQRKLVETIRDIKKTIKVSWTRHEKTSLRELGHDCKIHGKKKKRKSKREEISKPTDQETWEREKHLNSSKTPRVARTDLFQSNTLHEYQA